MKDRMIGPEEVVEKFGVPPEKVIEVQALAGDSVDNVPGVPGIGIKTAAQLIETYGDLETLLERAEEIKQPKRRQNLIDNAELARISKALVTLKADVPVEASLDEFGLREPDPADLRDFLERYEFRSVLVRLKDQLDGGEPTESPEGAEAAYELVQDLEVLKAWVAAGLDQGIVAVDTETTGLDAMAVELVGVSLALKPGKACYIPLAHRAPGVEGELALGDAGGLIEGQIPRDAALAALKPLLEDPGTLKIGQNIKYDMLIFARQGIDVAPVDDTMLLSYVLEGGLHGHGMDELAQLHLGHDTIKFSQVAGTGKAQVGQGPGLRRRGRRRDLPAARGAEAPAPGPAHGDSLRDHRAALGSRPGRHGAGRHQARPGRPAAPVQRLRPAHRRAGAGDPHPGRPAFHHRLAQAAGRDPVRRDGPGQRPQGQERHPGDRRRRAGGPGGPGP
jgi:DNA polymerase-1